MADEHVRRQVWDGAVVVCLFMDSEDVVAREPPSPYYVLARRMDYLPMAAQPALQYFRRFAGPLAEPSDWAAGSSVWFEALPPAAADSAELASVQGPASGGPVPAPLSTGAYGAGTVLRWQLPLGVLYDLTCAAAAADGSVWRVAVHFRARGPKAPERDLLPWAGEDDVKRAYMNALKEACYMKFGDARRVNDLSVAEQDALWCQLVRPPRSLDAFWAVQARLVPAAAAAACFLPVRVLLRPDAAPRQFPAPAARGWTLGEYLAAAVPERFGPRAPSATPAPDAVVHGAPMPLEVGLYWLCVTCCSGDNFLYITLRSK